MTMFSQFTNQTSKKVRKSSLNIPKTTAFVQALVSEGVRISYGGLATVALELGEVKPSGQSLGQRGIGLVKALPGVCQPMVCRGGNPNGETFGTYHKKSIAAWEDQGITFDVDELVAKPVLGKDTAAEAVLTWLESIDPETGEPLEEEPTLENDLPTGLESDDDPTDDDQS